MIPETNPSVLIDTGRWYWLLKMIPYTDLCLILVPDTDTDTDTDSSYWSLKMIPETNSSALIDAASWYWYWFMELIF